MARESVPLVSIVTPTYKRPQFLARAIDSIIAQTFNNWELMVVDDNGAESEYRQETQSFMQRYKADARIIYIEHESNLGGSAARNTGIRQARGKYVAFLDDDDEWLPEKLEKQLSCLVHASPEVALVYTGYENICADPELMAYLGRFHLPTLRGNLLEELLKENCVGTTSSVLCRRDALLEVGLFDESLAASQDYDLFLRLAQHFEFEVVSEPLVRLHRHKEGNIGGDHKAKVEAYKSFYKKHQALMKQHPASHLYHLKWMGRYFLRAGYKHDAKDAFRRALRLSPWDFSSLSYLLLSALSDRMLERLWALRRRLRAITSVFS